MRPRTRLLYEEQQVLGRTPKASRPFPPQVAYFYAAPLAQFCSALDKGLRDPRFAKADSAVETESDEFLPIEMEGIAPNLWHG